MNKAEYRHWYFRRLLRLIHSMLPSTERLIVAGYSFPDADIAYLREIFVPAVIREDAEVEVVNPSNDEPNFRERVRETFPSIKEIRFGEKDFRVFCAELDVEYPDRPSLRANKGSSGETMNQEAGQPTPAQDG